LNSNSSRRISSAFLVGAEGSATGSVEFFGDVTEIAISATPEPATTALIVGGLGALLAIRRCRR
jgi:hypothetical protein